MRLGSYYRALLAPGLGLTAAGGRVLEVGAADAQLLRTLRPCLGVALDPAPIRQDTVQFLRADGRYAPFKPASFDMVIAFDVLEHVEEDRRLLAEILRVAKQGGTVWLSVPSKNFRAFPPFLTSFFHARWGHVRPGYSREELGALLPSAVPAEVREWNEPFYRLFYIPLRFLSILSPTLVEPALRLIARLDSKFQGGDHGHYFLRVSL